MSLTHFCHLSQSCDKTRLNCVHLPNIQTFSPKSLNFLILFQNNFDLWPLNTGGGESVNIRFDFAVLAETISPNIVSLCVEKPKFPQASLFLVRDRCYPCLWLSYGPKFIIDTPSSWIFLKDTFCRLKKGTIYWNITQHLVFQRKLMWNPQIWPLFLMLCKNCSILLEANNLFLICVACVKTIFRVNVREHPDLNQRPLDMQSNALPLSYVPLFLYYKSPCLLYLWSCRLSKGTRHSNNMKYLVFWG